MGCDGVWEKKSNDEMVAWIYDRLNVKMSLNEILQQLLQTECLSTDYTQSGGLGCDNMTAILVTFGN